MLPSKFKSTALSKVSVAVELRPKSTSPPNRRVSQGKNVLRKMKSEAVDESLNFDEAS
jgi:hypothetical protein